ncbi:hypothetical protein ATANTOWER_010254 [Ataeniobius toweri]|uniref:Chromo shadow domain-containing protein n=1 Tax=Ataeniobius toweri TaxID=208326 RepID=A0ABU7BZV1_9TELE|nr:hypothetical protein [Ataeniobius toweri]
MGAFTLEPPSPTHTYQHADRKSTSDLSSCLYHCQLDGKNSDDVALLSAREASARCPQVVIDFYEQKLTWHSGDEEQ